jgi:TonB family protein
VKKHRTNKEHLSATEIEAYLNASLTDTEMHHAEKHLLECDFCSEAMDGYASVFPGISVQKEVADLNKRIDKRVQKKKKNISFFRIAAIAIVLIVSSLFIANYFISKNKNPQFSENKSTKKESVKNKKVEGTKKEEEAKSVELDKSTDTIQLDNKKAPSSSPLPQKTVEVEKFSSTTPISNYSSADSEMMDEVEYLTEIESVEIRVENSKESFETPGKLRGKVIDTESKEAIPFASVTLKTHDSIITGIATDFDGVFNFDSLESAEYIVEVTALGYTKQSIHDVEITTNEITYQDIEISGGVELESVEIVTYNEDSQAQKRSVSSFSSTVSGVDTKKSRSKEKTIKNNKALPIIGQVEYDRYLTDSLNYPEEALLAEISGEVVVKFTVSETGELTNFQIQKSLGFGCDEEAIRLIQEGPEWDPAIKKGKPIAEEVKVKVLFE